LHPPQAEWENLSLAGLPFGYNGLFTSWISGKMDPEVQIICIFARFGRYFMKKSETHELDQYLSGAIERFHQERIQMISQISLSTLLMDPVQIILNLQGDNARKFIEGLLVNYLSCQEGELFNGMMKHLAIHIANTTHECFQSPFPGIDLIFAIGGILYIITIQTNPAIIANADNQIFSLITKEQGSSLTKTDREVVKVIGNFFGNAPSNGNDHGTLTLEGKDFWALLSNNDTLYLDMIESITLLLDKYSYQYQLAKGVKIDSLTNQFIMQFCDQTGVINRKLLLQ